MPRHSLPDGTAAAEAGSDESSTPLRPRTRSFLDGVAELLPQDLQENYYESRHKPGATALRASLALLSASSVVVAIIALPLAAYRLYGFDQLELQCTSDVADESRHAIETAIGAAPIQLRSMLIGFVAVKLCRKFTGARGDGIGLARALFTMPSAEGDAAVLSNAGWEAIVGRWIFVADAQQQPNWEQVRDARKLTQQQSISSAIVKLVFWHWSQPVAFLWMLDAYRCDIALLGVEHRGFAAVVAAREMLYLATTIAASWQCPVFLLMDPITAWSEARGFWERARRAAMWVLTPHNYTALCLANRFRGNQWRYMFMGLATIQTVADISSCVGLAALIQTAIEAQKANQVGLNTPTAIIIGYVITAAGFLLFFGPMSVVASYKSALDNKR